jgi:hypothetical protein
MPDLTELSDAARKLALERYRKLRPHLAHNLPLLQVAREATVPLRPVRLNGTEKRRKTTQKSHAEVRNRHPT